MESSMFGRLPAELRNNIYELALLEHNEDSRTIDLESWTDKPFSFIHSRDDGSPCSLGIIGLPQTCRQIRRESLRLYYSLNRFYFETEYLKSSDKDGIIERLQEFARRIGPRQAKEIRDVTINLGTVKGHDIQPSIDWRHMALCRGLFHPRGHTKIRFHLGSCWGTEFTLSTRRSIFEQLDHIAEIWAWTWQKLRKYSETEARRMAERYKQDVARLFEDMPKVI
ncbi:hypothetical protein HII31_04575 [Pseudocercospora fuligena]|uniref:2EXR domain-containing protein n=1 Tax=Pseudocercospora fuligena TaxID=685502 RepID=A0A8H6VMY1_9PEZI|nr:hypothetical protein HII31_04575 [Pseudocercospora fuligena]